MREKLKFDLTVAASALLNPNPTEFYGKAYLKESDINAFRVLPGIKYATKISTVTFDNLLRASSCSFTTDGAILSAITIDVQAVSAMAEICRFDLEQSYIANQMPKGSNASFEVASFMSFYWDEMAKQIGQEIETIRWVGSTTNGAYTGTSAYKALADGYEKKLLADSQVIDVTLTASTVANVIASFTAVVAALPATININNPDLRLYVSSNVAKNYAIATSTVQQMQANLTSYPMLSFVGIPIVICPGMSSNKMALTLKNNFIYAFDGEGDGKELKAVNLEDSIAEPLLRTRANLKMGFYITNPAEIVYFN